MVDREKHDLIKSFTETLLEYKEEIRTLKERCESLEKQLLEQTSTAIVYKDLFNEAKRVIGEDTLYKLIYKEYMYNEEID